MNNSSDDPGCLVDAAVRRLHVIPIGDEHIHAAQEICWCHPASQDGIQWTHNAKDCREARERHTKEQESEGWIIIAEYVSPNK
jgi:hypothetical protein